MSTPMQQVSEKCKQLFELAKELYDVDLSAVRISFDLKGRVAGTAGYKSTWGGTRNYYLRFNHDMVQRELESMLNEVAPHEVAHTICQMRPELGSNHDYGWATVCRRLGGSGRRTHSMKVVFGKGRTYEYTTLSGSEVRLSERRHKDIQGGRSIWFLRGIGVVNKSCSYKIVGEAGRTFGTPVVRTGTPAVVIIEKPVVPVLKPRKEVVFDPEAIQAAAAAKANGLRTVPTSPRPAVRSTPVTPTAGGSKADVARRIMVDGHMRGDNYETILQAIMLANGHDRRLAASYYKNNAPKVGVPLPE